MDYTPVSRNAIVMDRLDIEMKVKKEKPNNYLHIREKGEDLARAIDKACPNNERRDIALNRLNEVILWANASLIE